MITDSEVDEPVNGNPPAYWHGYNVFFSTLGGSLTGNCTTYTSNPGRLLWDDFTDEPAGFAINTDNGHFFFSLDGPNSRVYEIGLGPDSTYCTSDDTVTRILASIDWGVSDAEDVAYGNNTLYISDGINGEVYSIPLGLDGVLGGGDDGPVTHWDTASQGFHDVEGIGFNPDRNTLFVVSTVGSENYLGEFSLTGTLLRAFDLAFMGTTANLRSDVVWAPSSQDPDVKSIYIASRGVDNNANPLENDGKIWEVSLGPLPGAFTKLTPQNGSGSQPSNPVIGWSASMDAVEYEYCIDTTDDNSCTDWVRNGTATSAALNGLTSARTYYWQVRAIGGGGLTYANGSLPVFWNFTTWNVIPPSWYGGVAITSDVPVVSVARPHVGDEVASYDGVKEGGLTAYVPMLFKGSFGGSYNAALYVQNIDPTHTANITVKFYDNAGTLSCTENAAIAPRASKGYWVPDLTCLPAGWVGGAVITSDYNVVAVGRPHVGAEVMTYNGFSSGSLTSYLPMLFKTAWGSYDAAFYVQNVHESNTANITIKFYDSAGTLSCTQTSTIAPLASKGWWVPNQTCLPVGWVGGAVVTSDQPVVTIGRPHVGSQVTSYSGLPGGSPSMYVPMLFKNAFGGSYDAAFYVQNVDTVNTANITIKYYDSTGALTCNLTSTVAPLASRGWWVPGQSCLPVGWVGGAVVTSDTDIVAVGRAHVDTQVTTYPGIGSGGTNLYLPMLFKNAFGGSYNSAFYVQNTDELNPANVTLKFYDADGNLSCTRSDSIPALATLGYWVPSVTCGP